MMERMWVNQPSTSQPLHKYHGQNVLYDRKGQTLYFCRGSVISMMVPTNPLPLSFGWQTQSEQKELP